LERRGLKREGEGRGRGLEREENRREQETRVGREQLLRPPFKREKGTVFAYFLDIWT
jgi:hypothetical protein